MTIDPALAAAIRVLCDREWTRYDLDRRTCVWAWNGKRGEAANWRDFAGDTMLAVMEAAIAAGIWDEPEPSPVLAHLAGLPDREWQRARREAAS